MRAVTGRPVHVYFSVEAEDGALTAVDSATTVSVDVEDAAGSTASVGAAASTDTEGVYKYTFTGPSLGTYTATATATVDGFPQTITEIVEVVGSRIVPLNELRSRTALADLSTGAFLRTVDRVEQWVTEMLDYSPVAARSTVAFAAEWTLGVLHVPGIHYARRLVSLTRDGITVDLTGLVLESDGAFRFPTAAHTYFYPGLYVATVEHGRWDEVPGDLQRATTSLADHIAPSVESLYPARATRVMTEASEIFFGNPDGDKKLTGIPEVDGVLARYRLRMPV